MSSGLLPLVLDDCKSVDILIDGRLDCRNEARRPVPVTVVVLMILGGGAASGLTSVFSVSERASGFSFYLRAANLCR